MSQFNKRLISHMCMCNSYSKWSWYAIVQEIIHDYLHDRVVFSNDEKNVSNLNNRVGQRERKKTAIFS